MRLIFTRQRSLTSLLIRWFTWSRWSHVAVQAGEHLVIDARFWGHGVRYRSVEQLLASASAHAIVDIDVPDEAAARRWLCDQIGKPYDWTAVLGLLWRAPGWARDDAWFCSELAEAALLAGGLSRFRQDASRITPEHCWMVR